MSKIMIGVVTAALWFVLAHVANAEQVCRQVCDHGTCVSQCFEHRDSDVTVHEHDRGPPPAGVGVHVLGVDIDVGR
jgi:hypothetical protein